MAKVNSWVYVDKSAIKHNIKEVRKHIGDTRLLAVVKADAYGHGAVEMARLMLEEGINYLGVALPTEVFELRQAGIGVPILLMSPSLPDQYAQLIAAGCTLTINNLASVVRLQEAALSIGRTARVHININTGMFRYGVDPKQVIALAKAINEQPLLELEGVYTHFSQAENKTITRKQLETFMVAVKKIRENNIDIPIVHCANSTATAHMPETHLDMVRVGTLLFGQCRVQTKLKLLPGWHLQARVINIVEVPRGQPIGYGGSYRVKRDSRIAIIPLGFADGISMWPVHRKSSIKDILKEVAKSILRFLGVNRFLEKAVIKGFEVPYIGKVGMQHLALDITDFNDIAIGDIATVRILQAAVSARLPRYYHLISKKQEGDYA